MSKATPPPWRLLRQSNGDPCIVGGRAPGPGTTWGGNVYLAQVYTPSIQSDPSSEGLTAAEAEANAALMTASPLLAEALAGLLALYNSALVQVRDPLAWPQVDHAFTRARLALDAAEAAAPGAAPRPHGQVWIPPTATAREAVELAIGHYIEHYPVASDAFVVQARDDGTVLVCTARDRARWRHHGLLSVLVDLLVESQGDLRVTWCRLPTGGHPQPALLVARSDTVAP